MKRNSFYYFYKYIFRRQIIDKLNITCLSELDLICTAHISLAYKSDYSNPLTISNEKIPSELLYFQYLIESFTNQKALAKTIQYPKGSKLIDALGSDYYIEYFVDIKSGIPFFEFISRLWVCLYYKRNILGVSKKVLISCDFRNSQFMIKDFNIDWVPWLDSSLFRQESLSFRITFNYNNYSLLILFLSRIQLLSQIKIKKNLVVQQIKYRKRIYKKANAKTNNKKRYNTQKKLRTTREGN